MSQLRTAVVLLVTLLLGLALAGCGAEPAGDSDVAQAEAPGIGLSGDDGGADEAQGEAAADDAGGGEEAGGAAGAEADADAAEAAAEGAVGASTASGAAQRGRKVVTTTIDVAVEDVRQSAQRVRDIALVAGGYVAAEETVGGEQPRAVLTLRVPVTGAADVMTDVAELGEEVNRTSDEEEVENRLVDLESRVATQRAGVERVRALLEDAQSLDDVLALERELTRRQADLESLDAQRAALDDRAALATVTVRLTLPEDAETAEAAEVPPFLRGLQGGWEALAASTGVVLVVLGSLLPFAVVALALGGVVLLAVRALRRVTGARSVSASPGAAGRGAPGGGAPAAARPAPVAPSAHNEV